MKVLKLRIERKVMKWIALMFATAILTTGCGTGQKAAVSETPPPEAYYQLTDDCALLHIYRPGAMAGSLISYDLHLDEWKLFRMKNKSKTTIKITQPGTFTLWAKTETREEFPVEIQLGNEYYIRCGISMGAFVGRPKIEMVYPQTGKYEFDKIPWNR
jgi:hypothetical protein